MGTPGESEAYHREGRSTWDTGMVIRMEDKEGLEIRLIG